MSSLLRKFRKAKEEAQRILEDKDGDGTPDIIETAVDIGKDIVKDQIEKVLPPGVARDVYESDVITGTPSPLPEKDNTSTGLDPVGEIDNFETFMLNNKGLDNVEITSPTSEAPTLAYPYGYEDAIMEADAQEKIKSARSEPDDVVEHRCTLMDLIEEKSNDVVGIDEEKEEKQAVMEEEQFFDPKRIQIILEEQDRFEEQKLFEMQQQKENIIMDDTLTLHIQPKGKGEEELECRNVDNFYKEKDDLVVKFANGSVRYYPLMHILWYGLYADAPENQKFNLKKVE